MKQLICLMLIAGAMACKNNQSDKDSVRIAKEANRDKADTGASMPMNKDVDASNMAVEKADANFAVEAANGNMIEMQLAALAQTKAVNERVKNFAKMMLNDHKKLNEDLQRIAKSKNITLPEALSDEAKKDIDRLDDKNHANFDRKYIRMMVNDHKKDVNRFEKAVKDCKDPELKSFIENALPVMRKHLDSANAIENIFVTGTREPSPAYP